MDTLTIILNLMQKNNCDNLTLANALGLNRQVVTDWKAKRSKSYNKYLPQIADYFGVSVDYLLGKEEKPATEGDELNEYLEELKSRPEMRYAFLTKVLAAAIGVLCLVCVFLDKF